jgi:WD40-like Beta Propeller Repeat
VAMTVVRPRALRRRLALVGLLFPLALTHPISSAGALTCVDGLVAIAASPGIEVFDPTGDGSDLHVLIPSTGLGAVSDPAWSPLGNLVVYQDEAAVWIAHAEGSYPYRLSDPQWLYSRYPSWSPDGRVAFIAKREVVIMAPDGSREVVIDPRSLLHITHVTIVGAPAWTPDGRLVILLRKPDSIRSPYILDRGGTRIRPLRHPDGTVPRYSGRSSAWRFSSTGLVAYEVYKHRSDRRWVHFSLFDGRHVVEAPAGVAVDLDGAADIAFSPDGQRAVATEPDTDQDTTAVGIWGVDLASFSDSLHLVEEFQVPGTAGQPDWQPLCPTT